MIDIKGLDKAEVVYALYRAAQGEDVGVSKLLIQDRLDKGQTFFSAIGKKVLRIEVGGDSLNPLEYNRQNGAMRGEGLKEGKYVGRAQHALAAAGLIEEGPGTETGSRTLVSQPPMGHSALTQAPTPEDDSSEQDETDSQTDNSENPESTAGSESEESSESSTDSPQAAPEAATESSSSPEQNETTPRG